VGGGEGVTQWPRVRTALAPESTAPTRLLLPACSPVLASTRHQRTAPPSPTPCTPHPPPQELDAGGFTALLTYYVPFGETDSCGCLLAHKLGAALLNVQGIPFLTPPLSVPQVGGRRAGGCVEGGINRRSRLPGRAARLRRRCAHAPPQ
jgi:hypothetical protein